MPRVTPVGARFHESSRRMATALALAALAFGVYSGNGHIHSSNGDTLPASLVATTLLVDGGLHLDRFADVWRASGRFSRPAGLPYFLVHTPRGVVSKYPVATGILAIPLMAPAVLAPTATVSAHVDAAHRQEKYAAALITAASVAIFAVLCRQLGFGAWLTVGLTCFYAFGSQAFNTSSQLLWQHGPGALFILLAFLYFARLREGATRALAVCFTIAWAVAVAIRPMNILVVGPLAVLALHRFPYKVSLALPAVFVGVPVVAYNLYFFQALRGGYVTEPPFVVTHLPYGVAGLLFSPGRGLFLYFPVAVVALVLAFRRLRTTDDIARTVLVSFGAVVLFYGSYVHWHGGGSVGPRYLTEVQPLLLIVLGLLWPPRARTLGTVCFGVLLPYCIFIQVVGAYSLGPSRWNTDRISDGESALWDFRDNPISHGFR
jgi:hypothetical protein